MNYKQLTQEERHMIYALKKSGKCQKVIADELNRSPTSIARELKRNKGRREYRPLSANELCKQRNKIAFKARKSTTEVTDWIDKLLYNDFTPEQIPGRLFLEGKIKIHHETIYLYPCYFILHSQISKLWQVDRHKIEV